MESTKNGFTRFLLIVITMVFVLVSSKLVLAGMAGPGGEGEYTNLCGSGFDASFYNCPASCNPNSGSCSGPWVVRFTCNGRTGECGGGGSTPVREDNSGSFDLGACGITQRIDVFDHNCRAGGGWSCGSPLGYMVWYSGDCAPQQVCGNGVREGSEQCDNGGNNGNVPSVGYGETKSYCTNSCQTATVKGPFCGDGAKNGPEECDGNSGVPFGYSCNSQCRLNLVCRNECSSGDKVCSGNALKTCGNFDSDPCTEWKINDCYFKNEGSVYYQCSNDDSFGFKDVTTGFCNDKSGNNDYCDSKKTTEKVSQTDCGATSCGQDDYCKENDVYAKESCTVKGCKASTGKCFTDYTTKDMKIEECGINSQTGEFCDGESIVNGKTERGCKDVAGDAQCYSKSQTVLIEQCGSDMCTSFTNLDPYVKEYVDDTESCVENGYPYCSLDPGRIFDFCVNEDILNQAICQGNDHAFSQYDCSQKDGCYAFEFEECVFCDDGYGNCNGHKCKKTGQEYRDYKCGSGACNYTVDVQDTDNDRIDDRCDSCIDVDEDGVCDNEDNCLGSANSNQVDLDADGNGNACDNDKDGDGYSADVDCDDWDDDINPGAKEVTENGIDDDCNEGTGDQGAYTAREALYVDIQMSEEANLKAGQDMTVVVSVSNRGEKDLKNVQVGISLPGYQIRENKLVGKLDSDDSAARIFKIKLPKDLNPGYEYLRVAVSNDNYKRIIYREVKFD